VIKHLPILHRKKGKDFSQDEFDKLLFGENQGEGVLKILK
jgi:hypothetical protein